MPSGDILSPGETSSRDEAARAGAPQHNSISRGMTFLLAFACGAVVANLYYAQPLVGLIGPAIGLNPRLGSVIVTLTQIGYGAGLVLLVPLGDLLENRRLVVTTLCGTILALGMAALAPNAAVFLWAALLIGISSVVVQMLVPLAAHMAPDASRGRVVGNVMSGLVLGILLSRPIASMMADLFGWRAVFGVSAVAMAALAVLLSQVLPRRKPVSGHSYLQLLASLWTLWFTTPILRRRATYQACLFAAFSLFWTAVPLELTRHFGIGQRGIALFALAGAAGAFSAPIAGRLADRGLSRIATVGALMSVAAAFLLAEAGGRIGGHGSVALLVVAGILLDLGVQANVVLGQRAIYSLGAHLRSRLNGIYMAVFFLGGAAGSAIASWLLATGGWSLVAWVGFAFPCLGLAAFVTGGKDR